MVRIAGRPGVLGAGGGLPDKGRHRIRGLAGNVSVIPVLLFYYCFQGLGIDTRSAPNFLVSGKHG